MKEELEKQRRFNTTNIQDAEYLRISFLINELCSQKQKLPLQPPAQLLNRIIEANKKERQLENMVQK